MSSLKLTGQVTLTPTSGIQSILNNLVVARSNYNEGDGFSTTQVAASATKALNFVDSPTAGGTLFIMFSDQPLSVAINGLAANVPCNEMMVLTASATTGNQINSISVTNLNAIDQAIISYMLVK
jgi:hypothetical protein